MKHTRLLAVFFFLIASALFLARCSESCIEDPGTDIVECPVVDDDDIIDDNIDDIDEVP